MTVQTDGLLSPWLSKQRIKIVRPYMKGRVLDYGCGAGALAEISDPDIYLGVDIDEESLKNARKRYLTFRFEKEIPKNEKFDTILLLAVIEHIKDPETFLKEVKQVLMPGGQIILTTPHPLMEKIHFWGSKIRLFSAYANEEHKGLLDYEGLKKKATRAGLIIYDYKRFLLGANQLFILTRQ